MAFNLKKVLKALLLSTSQPLSIKEIQAAFTRFHEQGAELIEDEGEESPAAPGEAAAAEAQRDLIETEETKAKGLGTMSEERWKQLRTTLTALDLLTKPNVFDGWPLD